MEAIQHIERDFGKEVAHNVYVLIEELRRGSQEDAYNTIGKILLEAENFSFGRDGATKAIETLAVMSQA